jgi:hypothetical protein
MDFATASTSLLFSGVKMRREQAHRRQRQVGAGEPF